MIDKIILENAITPAAFLKIVSGLKEKLVLPEDRPTYLRDHPQDNHPPQEMIDRLHAVGIFHTKGLTCMQAKYLLGIIVNRSERGLALPWQLKAISKGKRMKIADRHFCFASITRYEAEQMLA